MPRTLRRAAIIAVVGSALCAGLALADDEIFLNGSIAGNSQYLADHRHTIDQTSIRKLDMNGGNWACVNAVNETGGGGLAGSWICATEYNEVRVNPFPLALRRGLAWNLPNPSTAHQAMRARQRF